MITANSVLIGESLLMRRLRSTIERIASAGVPVLIEGPTGSGKELVASLLHQLSGRSGELVAFNVCAIADTMFEDALFGHVRGAYTGAGTDTPGFLREAHRGSLFFDEIGGLPLALQAKLLRAIETGVFRPIGSSRDSKSEFRLITATNEGVAELVASGRFRSDLAYRMSGVVLHVPALDDRLEDVPALVAHFAGGRRVDGAAVGVLQARQWPGNVRELKQVVDAAGAFSRGAIDADAVALALAHRSRAVDPRPRPVPMAIAEVSSSADYSGMEKRRLISVLDSVAWNTVQAANDLGIHRSTLYRRLKRLRVSLPPAASVRAASPVSADPRARAFMDSQMAAP